LPAGIAEEGEFPRERIDHVVAGIVRMARLPAIDAAVEAVRAGEVGQGVPRSRKAQSDCQASPIPDIIRQIGGGAAATASPCAGVSR